MDIATILGLVVAFGAIIGSALLDGTHISTLLNGSAAILVLGGTLGATAITSSMSNLAKLPKILGGAFSNKGQEDPAGLIEAMVGLAEKGRREGLLSLESETGKIKDHFLIKGLALAIDGVSADAIRGVMETQMMNEEKVQHEEAGILEAAGGFAPTMGIIGTVIGLVHVLGNLSDMSKLASSIAVAFLATLYGIGTANLMWLPIAAKLKAKSRAEGLLREMVVEGVLAIQAGDNPKVIRERLEGYLPGKKGGKSGKGK